MQKNPVRFVLVCILIGVNFKWIADCTCGAAKCLVNFQTSRDIDGHETDAGSVTKTCLPDLTLEFRVTLHRRNGFG